MSGRNGKKKKNQILPFRKDLEQAEVFQAAVRAACLAALRAKSLMLTLFLKPRPRFDEISLRRSCEITSLHVHTWAEQPPRCIFPLRRFKCSPASFWGFFFPHRKVTPPPQSQPCRIDGACRGWSAWTQAERDVNDMSQNGKKRKEKRKKACGLQRATAAGERRRRVAMPPPAVMEKCGGIRSGTRLKSSGCPATFTVAGRDVKLAGENRLQCHISHRGRWKWPLFTMEMLFSEGGGPFSSRLKCGTTCTSLDKPTYKTHHLPQSQAALHQSHHNYFFACCFAY